MESGAGEAPPNSKPTKHSKKSLKKKVRKGNKMIFSTPFPAGMRPGWPNQRLLHRQWLRMQPRNLTHLHIIILLLLTPLPLLHPHSPILHLHPPTPLYPHPPGVLWRSRIRNRTRIRTLSRVRSRRVYPRYGNTLQGGYKASTSILLAAFVEFDDPC